MKKLLFMASVFIVLGTMTGFSQKVNLDGDLDFLKGEKKVALEYKYDKMGVGKFKNGDDYIAKKTGEYNEKEAGRGDKWAVSWVGDRSERYEPKFEELLNKNCEMINFDQNNKANYTMIVETTFTEPGFNVGVMSKVATINLKITFVDKSGKEMAKMTIDKVPGRDAMGFDYDTGVRIEEAYAKAGKSVGKFIDKKIN